jgi:hypothetical protein
LKKKYLVLIIVLFITAMTVSCTEDKVQNDLIDYANTKLPEVSLLQKEAMIDYNNVKDGSKDAGSIMVKKVIPEYKNFLNKLSSIHPKTTEVSQLNQIYLDAANLQYSAFIKISKSIETNNKDLVKSANSDLEKARVKISEFKLKLSELADKHKVKIENY